MAHITKIEFWHDCGFQEGSVIMPTTADTLPDPDLFYDDPVRPSRSDLFSSFDLPVEYAELINVQYLRVTYDFEGAEMVFYGYVDSVSVISSTSNVSTRVTWHIDLWRTYLPSATFGYGMVSARPASDTDPPQTCSYRYRLPGDFITGRPYEDTVNWLIFTYVKESDDGRETSVRTCFLPIDKDLLNNVMHVSDGEHTYTCPSLADIAQGDLADKYGISASQITSAYISPVCPASVSREGNVFTLDTESEEGSTTTTEVSYSSYKRPASVTFDFAGLVPTTSTAIYNVSTEYSDGTSDHATLYSTQVRNFIESCAYVAPGILHNTRSPDYTVDRPYYITSIRTFASQCLPDQAFRDGDRLTVFAAAEWEPVWSGGSGGIGGDLSYEHEDYADHEFTYNSASGGWPEALVFNDYDPPRFYFTFQRNSAQYAVSVEQSGDNGYFYTVSQDCYEHPYTYMYGRTTTDTAEWVLTDMSGLPVATVPWGITLTDGTVRTVISSTSAYIQYRFNGTDSSATGTEFTVPLPSVDVCSNSWNDYLFSGQKEYDCEQRRIASEQAMVNGITSTFTGGVSNSIMASIGEQKYKTTKSYEVISGNGTEWLTEAQLQRMEGGIVGTGRERRFTTTKVGFNPMRALGASIGVGVAASAIDYASSLYYNGQLQHAEDTLQAKQFDAVTIPSSGWDWLWHGRDPGFITMVPDDYSLTRFDTDRSLNGIYCSEPTADCSSLISAGGPLRISELEVRGNIPVPARSYIKGRFANGVRMVTRNTQE